MRRVLYNLRNLLSLDLNSKKNYQLPLRGWFKYLLNTELCRSILRLAVTWPLVKPPTMAGLNRLVVIWYSTCFLVWEVAYLSLKTSIDLFFFLILFSRYCCFVDPLVVSIVSSGRNQSSSHTFLCSLQGFVSTRLQCWQILFLLLFLIHIVSQRHLWDVMPYALSLVFLFSDPFA